jgi:hypothetical protein
MSKAKQKTDRKIVHSPDMGADTSDNRCSNIKGIYNEKVGWVFDSNLPWDEYYPLFCTPGISLYFCCYTVLSVRLVCLLNFGK